MRSKMGKSMVVKLHLKSHQIINNVETNIAWEVNIKYYHQIIAITS
jgi:hypothetical protein